MTIPPPDKTPDKTVEWAALAAHAREAALDIPALLKDSDRTGRMVLTGADFTVFDFTHHRASHETMRLLHDFARARDVAGACTAMMAGRVVNPTENRPAWHTALRDPAPPAPVRGMLDGMRAFVNRIRADKSVTDVIHVGIGGSILGTQLVCDALRAEADGPRIHFIAGYDATERHPLLERLDPAATLVVAASKTFTTLETRFNLDCLKNWLGPARAGRIAAATANPQAAREAGVDDANILAFPDWVGGRFSVWSSVGVTIALAHGFTVFERFLAGAHAADRHLAEAVPERNIPLTMALLQLWYRNFLGCSAYAVLPYVQRLALLPAYLQQLEMESNGKRVDCAGRETAYATAPVVFGATGTAAQHAFMQMVHQGTDVVPCDFVGMVDDGVPGTADLNRHMRAQIRALAEGGGDRPETVTPGNRPATAILLPRIDAFTLGHLMAVEEHKTAILGFLWNINPFDQFGVELGKKLLG